MQHRRTKRDYPRTARLNALLQEILADALERFDDERLELVTVTSVACEADLRHAVVYVDSLGGPDEDEVLLEALGEVRPRLQGAIADQARLKRTPELWFSVDEVVRSANRIEEVLRRLHEPGGS
ncbi:MAG: 30S ribosome-binding factor RbfA [Actinobacteria bacterium]|nr:30S ribosome-binding factor RbfA [Actinomycetota bacterium]